MSKELEEYLKLKLINEFKDALTDFQKVQLENLILFFGKKFLIKIENKEAVYKFLKYNVDGNWIERLSIIREKLRHDSSSLYSFQIRYGEISGYELWADKTRRTTNNLKSFILKFGEEKGALEYEKYKKSKKSIGLDVMKERYGEKEGAKRWVEYLEKKQKTLSEKNGWSNGLTLQELQRKHGDQKGSEVWNKKRKKQSKRFSLEYYIEKHGDEIGKIKWVEYCKGMDKGSLSYFVKKYGDEKGQLLYNERCEKIRKSNSLEFLKKKYGEVLGEKKYIKKKEDSIRGLKELIKLGYSKISQELFWSIYNDMEDEIKENCFFAELNKEESFYFNDADFNMISVDFKLGNKIIEFYGDFWHANEKIYEDNYVFKDKKREIKAVQIRERDCKRLKKLKECGYEILIIWESDFILNKDKIKQECLKFLKNNIC